MGGIGFWGQTGRSEERRAEDRGAHVAEAWSALFVRSEPAVGILTRTGHGGMRSLSSRCGEGGSSAISSGNGNAETESER